MVVFADLARMGLCLLDGGKFRGKQVIPADWVKEMSSAQVSSVSAGVNEQIVADIRRDPSSPFYTYFDPEQNDWMQGYGYQMWRCRHGAFRADGVNGQYILVLPEQDAVIGTLSPLEISLSCADFEVILDDAQVDLRVAPRREKRPGGDLAVLLENELELLLIDSSGGE